MSAATVEATGGMIADERRSSTIYLLLAGSLILIARDAVHRRDRVKLLRPVIVILI